MLASIRAAYFIYFHGIKLTFRHLGGCVDLCRVSSSQMAAEGAGQSCRRDGVEMELCGTRLVSHVCLPRQGCAVESLLIGHKLN